MHRAHFTHPQSDHFRRDPAEPPSVADGPRAAFSPELALLGLSEPELEPEPESAVAADEQGAPDGGLLDEIPSAYEAIFGLGAAEHGASGAAEPAIAPMEEMPVDALFDVPAAEQARLEDLVEDDAGLPLTPLAASEFPVEHHSLETSMSEQNVAPAALGGGESVTWGAAPDAAEHLEESAVSASGPGLSGSVATSEGPRSRVEGILGGVARIRVVGVGGGGCNSVEGMLRMGLSGVDFLVMNTDAQALAASSCERRLQIGASLTHGLGAGADPEIGRAAAEESAPEIIEFLRGADMVFITAGMGGGTGTGAAPVVARLARELGILSAAVCTKPFRFEGARRMQRADEGLRALQDAADTMLVVANDKLLASAGAKMPLREAFAVANMVLGHSVSAISDIVNITGLVNVDFADVRAIMRDSGDAIIGIGRAKGEQRALNAVRKACSSPLLESLVIDGAGGILISIVGGNDLTLHEVSEAVGMVSGAASPEADIIFGAAIDDRLGEEVKATVLATRFERTRPASAAEAEAASLAASHAPTNAQGTLRDELGYASSAAPAMAAPSLSSQAEEEALERLFGMPFDPAAAGAGAGAPRANGHANGRNGDGAATSAERLGLAEDAGDDERELPAYMRRRRRRFF